MTQDTNQVIEYKITKEGCQKVIDENGGVCGRCGGELKPMETVDNSGDPTFWSACHSCNVFDWGTPKIVHEIAKELVVNKYYVPYSHLGSSYGLSGEDLAYWHKSQIGGACGIVSQVLNIHKKLTT